MGIIWRSYSLLLSCLMETKSFRASATVGIIEEMEQMGFSLEYPAALEFGALYV